jgi:hypothetical protein
MSPEQLPARWRSSSRPAHRGAQRRKIDEESPNWGVAVGLHAYQCLLNGSTPVRVGEASAVAEPVHGDSSDRRFGVQRRRDGGWLGTVVSSNVGRDREYADRDRREERCDQPSHQSPHLGRPRLRRSNGIVRGVGPLSWASVRECPPSVAYDGNGIGSRRSADPFSFPNHRWSVPLPTRASGIGIAVLPGQGVLVSSAISSCTAFKTDTATSSMCRAMSPS